MKSGIVTFVASHPLKTAKGGAPSVVVVSEIREGKEGPPAESVKNLGALKVGGRRTTVETEPNVYHSDISKHELLVIIVLTIWIVLTLELERIQLRYEVQFATAFDAFRGEIISRLDCVRRSPELCSQPEVLYVFTLCLGDRGGDDLDSVFSKNIGPMTHAGPPSAGSISNGRTIGDKSAYHSSTNRLFASTESTDSLPYTLGCPLRLSWPKYAAREK